jgi:hypothetical protein
VRFVPIFYGFLATGLALAACEGRPPLEPERGDPAPSRAHQDRNRIEWPGGEFRRLQDAIDAAPHDGVIEIQAGDYFVGAPLVVREDLELAGAGSGRDGVGPMTRLMGRAPFPVVDEEGGVIPPAEAEALISVGADLVVRDMVLAGFDAAIVARDDDAGRAGKTSVRDVVVEDTGRGIVSLGSGDLIVQDVDVVGTLWHGISVSSAVLASILIQDAKIVNPGCAGIYFENTSMVIATVTVGGAGCGGIVGFQSNGLILDSFLLGNRRAGIVLAEASTFFILDNVIENTLPTQFLQIGGDGISLYLSPDVTVEGNWTAQSARAGLGAYGSGVTIEDNTMLCSAFDIDNEVYQGVPTVFDDMGGNQCGCGGPLGDCEAVSSQIVPAIPENQS